MLVDQFGALQAGMLADAPLETVGLGRAGWWTDKRGTHLLWRGLVIAQPSDYMRRGGAGAVVSPDFLARGIKAGRADGDAMVLAHTHPFSGTPGFSGIDDGGEDELIPKMRARIEGAPHSAIVLGTVSASVRTWPAAGGSPHPATLRIVGARTNAPGPAVATQARQELALGAGSSLALASKTVTVIGTGGLGWSIAQSLWTHGVGRLILVDPDSVEVSNLSRLPGCSQSGIGRPKVSALADLLRSQHDGDIDPFASPFSDPGPRAAAASSDLLISATDSLSSRFDADRFGRRLLIPLIDSGINVQVTSTGVDRVGGRVTVSWPTGPCMSCMAILTPDALAMEADPLGYRGTGRAEEAAVHGFNAVLAGLATVEALDLLVRFRGDLPRSRYLVYDGLDVRVREIAVPAPDSCGSCGRLLGDVHGDLP